MKFSICALISVTSISCCDSIFKLTILRSVISLQFNLFIEINFFILITYFVMILLVDNLDLFIF